MSCYEAALAAASAGISVWPPMEDGSKRPVGEWMRGQHHCADAGQIEAWYAHGLTGVGWVCGHISESLEVIDFDDRAVWMDYQRLAREAGLGELLDRVMAGYLEYSPKGAHLAYRCPEIEQSQKLAKRRDQSTATGWKTLIETKGEGGYIIVAPTHGGVNASGAYEMRSGGPGSIVDITAEERRALLTLARSFDEYEAIVDTYQPTSLDRAGERPGDDFRARASWDEVLVGWTRLGTHGGVTRWRRPGKKDGGISATTGYGGTDLLYVFTTSTALPENRGLNKFSAYAILNHGGDFKEASKALALQGYRGLEIPDHGDVDTSEFMRNLFGPKGAERVDAVETLARPPELDGLLKVPGTIGELAEWIEAGASRSQPILALGASIAAMSTIVGRKVASPTGLRSNLYVLGIGESGCGKDRARDAISQLFSALAIGDQLGDTFTSGAAIETAIERNPVRLFLIDEIGMLLGAVNAGEGHVRDIESVLLRMYGASKSVYRRREYAGKEKTQVETIQPSLSIYGTTVPSNFCANLSKASIANGLLGRLLVFESLDYYPPDRMAPEAPVPAALVDMCARWTKAPKNADENAGDIEALTMPAPRKIAATAGASTILADLEQSIRKRIEQVRAHGGDQAPYTRVTATAWKLALIRACGIDPDPQITEDDATWAAGLSWRLTEDLIARLDGGAPENKTEEASQRILATIRKAGADGIARKDLIRRSRFLSGKGLNEVIDTLQEAGEVILDVQVTDSGRKKTTYRAVS